MIDNTWATPLIYKPIPEGFDYSIQAGTKYFAGHSDLLIGSISASERAWPALPVRARISVAGGDRGDIPYPSRHAVLARSSGSA
jgi:cystathionine beta-lyase/cystathionine gamma-synthase